MGHLVGSRALCRMAHVLQNYSRKIDTAARYGGDEFALVIPEAGIEVARQLAHRILEQLSADGEEPVLSASIGAAVCPQDGKSIEKLLRAADRDLYEGKRRSGEPRLLLRTLPTNRSTAKHKRTVALRIEGGCWGFPAI